ncbi:membrane protease subunit HflK [Formivibrio citricus]|uniref:Protein HflK n=1 Tax=Formivibrio citricus TaxID=83765 RepID=A0A1I4XAM3_9NEIS|nr:FtsH protease activity modulator HflK [Formivibrio citricus]SFN22957.1 membrane protease subunit HflK [Formivibrio citricus]
MSQNDPQQPGGGNKNDGPPDLEEIIRGIKTKLGGFFGGGASDTETPSQPRPGNPGSGKTAGVGAAIILTVLAVLWAGSGLFIVNEQENAVVTRFGRYTGQPVNKSGLHWRLPWPIESHEVVNMTEIRSLKVGGGGKDDAMMLTKDLNVVDMQFEVQYNLKSVEDFVFNNYLKNRDPSEVVRQTAEAAIREVVGSNEVDDILYKSRNKIAEDARAILQSLLDQYKMGVSVTALNIVAQPPEQVQAAFADAVAAKADAERLTLEGTAYMNDVIPKASGVSSRLRQEAEGYRQQVVSRAQGDASRFKQVLTEYAKAPQVTRDRMYLDAMQQVFQSTTKILVDQKGGNNLLYLPLDKLVQMTAPAQSTVGEAPSTNASPVAVQEPQPAPRTRRVERDGR